MPRRVLGLAFVVVALSVWAPAGASASAVTSVLAGETVSGHPIPCVAQAEGVRVCHGDDGGLTGPDLRLKSFDGAPLEVYMILPPAPRSGTDGNYPLIVQSHGWGGNATGLANSTAYVGPGAGQWATSGYAVLQLTARGFGDSCGVAARTAESPAHYAATCSKGYIRLDDERYEVRDVQNAVGLLADAGLANPSAIGVTGPSYGGGVSLELATLKNRVMNVNGTLTPWRSPAGKPLSITAAAPVIPWSDLAYSLEPNGRTLDYRLTGATTDLSPFGVEKQSFEGGLFALGQTEGSYSTPGADPQSDLTSWYATVNAGEPYGSKAVYIADQIARYHSAFYLLDNKYGTGLEAPAPLLISNGFTDDLFGVDEALRYYNLERALYPSDPIQLVDGDFGHMRANNKPADVALLSARIRQFFDHYLKHTGATPASNVTAKIETCPKNAPSGPTFSASTWAGLHPGEVDFGSPRSQTVTSGAGNPAIAEQIDPVSGPGACATVSAADQGAGVASYRLPAATGSGFTLLGSPTVIAKMSLSGSFPALAERLWDVDPSTNTETLVARGLYRPAASGQQVFELHPGAWHFAAGHIPKLELLSQDSPYGRASNGRFRVTVSNLSLRLPVHDLPLSTKAVGNPLPPVITGCSGLPGSTVTRGRLLTTRTRFQVSGTATDTTCAGDGQTLSSRQRLGRVFVVIFRPVGHDRCQFVTQNGRLGRPVLCTTTPPVKVLARGTRSWKLSRRVHLAPGRYLVASLAYDKLGQRQPAATVVLARVT
ncbi:MAG TPA: CocE/NonD family hydrolase [Solirubrobacteraceae bacterium]